MKHRWMGLAVITTLVMSEGCGSSRMAQTEQRLAEAEKKLEAATQALQEAQQQAAKKDPTAGGPEITKARSTVKESAEQVESAARDAKTVAAQEQSDKKAAEAAHKSAEMAETKAAKARKMAEPKKYTVAAGSSLVVRTTSAISTKTAESGSPFEATLVNPIEVDGYVIAPKGAVVEGVVVNSDSGGRVKGRASVSLTLRRIRAAGGQTIDIRTSAVGQQAASSVKKDAARIGIASGIGAAIGAIAGGGKGAAIGAGAGAAGGTGVTLATKGNAAVIPAESVLTFRLAEPFTVQENLR